MSEIINDNGEVLDDLVYREPIELPQRVNPFCVISKATFGEYAVRDIQTNSAWSENPYGDGYAVVSDEMVTAILETRGFCDIVLNEDGTEVLSFEAREIPEIPELTHEPTTEERIAELEMQLLESAETSILLYESQLVQEEINNAQDIAIIEIYEMLY